MIDSCYKQWKMSKVMHALCQLRVRSRCQERTHTSSAQRNSWKHFMEQGTENGHSWTCSRGTWRCPLSLSHHSMRHSRCPTRILWDSGCDACCGFSVILALSTDARNYLLCQSASLSVFTQTEPEWQPLYSE